MSAIAGVIVNRETPVRVTGGLLQQLTSAMTGRGSSLLTFHIGEGFGVAFRGDHDFPDGVSSFPVYDPTCQLGIVIDGIVEDPSGLVSACSGASRRAGLGACLIERFHAVGPSLFDQLSGAFSLAIWSESDQRMWLARSRCGGRQLFYREHKGGFAFATAVRAFAGEGGAVNAEAIRDIVTFGHSLESRAIFKDVMSVAPGSVVEYSSSGTRQRSMLHVAAPPATAGSLEKASAELRYRLVQAVARTPTGASPLLALGGVNSALLAWAAREAQKQVRLVVVDWPGSVDAIFAGAVAQSLNLPLDQVALDRKHLGQAADILATADEPMGDTGILALSCLSGKRGCNSVLFGDGADELLGAPSRAPFNGTAPGDSVIIRMAKLARLSGDLAGLTHGGGDVGWKHLKACLAGDASLKALAKFNSDTLLRRRILRSDIGAGWGGLDAYFPYLHDEVSSFAATLSDTQRGTVGNGPTRPLVRLALSEVLPHAFPYRSKINISLPAEPLLALHHDHLESMMSSSGSLSTVLDIGAARAVLARHRAGEAGLAQTLWNIFALGVWLGGLPTEGGCQQAA